MPTRCSRRAQPSQQRRALRPRPSLRRRVPLPVLRCTGQRARRRPHPPARPGARWSPAVAPSLSPPLQTRRRLSRPRLRLLSRPGWPLGPCPSRRTVSSSNQHPWTASRASRILRRHAIPLPCQAWRYRGPLSRLLCHALQTLCSSSSTDEQPSSTVSVILLRLGANCGQHVISGTRAGRGRGRGADPSAPASATILRELLLSASYSLIAIPPPLPRARAVKCSLFTDDEISI